MEIKSPYSIIDQIPSATNLSYLEEIEVGNSTKSTHLKPKTAYYFQVQGQMAATKTNYSDFLVYTTHGYFLERILFDKTVWDEALKRISWFWLFHLAPKILTPKNEFPDMEDGLDELLSNLNVEPVNSPPFIETDTHNASDSQSSNSIEPKLCAATTTQ